MKSAVKDKLAPEGGMCKRFKGAGGERVVDMVWMQEGSGRRVRFKIFSVTPYERERQ